MLLRQVNRWTTAIRFLFASRERVWVMAYIVASLLVSVSAENYDLGRKLFEGLPAPAHEFLEQQSIAIVIALFGTGLISFHRHRALAAREKSLKHEAHFDIVTQILNRRGFLDTLAKHLSNRTPAPLGLLLFDLDGFKAVNDTHGHAVGDLLLRAIPERITHGLPRSAVFARLSGDEFAIMINEGDDEAILRVASKVLADLSRPFHLEGKIAIISASIGIARFPLHSDHLDELVRKADVALYHSKRTGRNRITIYDAEIDAKASRRSTIETALRTAVDADDFQPFYQPIVDVHTGALIGFEVLARWDHAELGSVAPTEFIPVVSELGLLAPFTERLMAKALSEAKAWKVSARVSFNVSPVLFGNPEFVPMIMRLIEQSGIDPARLDLEVTEDALMTNPEVVSDTMFLLKGMGVTFSLDDFGVGYSSLTHLIDIPFDMIKMDRTLVRRASICPRSRALLIAVIGLGRSIGAKVLAEGVETLAEQDLIANLGCDFGQGWLYGRPMRVPNFERAGVRSLFHLRTKSLL